MSADVAFDAAALAWDKMDGLIPAVIQDSDTDRLLMMGYMDRTALQATIDDRLVTFFSRSKQRLWRKGQTSGNALTVQSIASDCDGDALLIRARPAGPTCHLGTQSCFGEQPLAGGWLGELERVINARSDADPETSYTARLLAGDPSTAAQKIGEEGVEVALAMVARDRAGVTEEAADLLFHLLVGLHKRGLTLSDVVSVLRSRHLSA